MQIPRVARNDKHLSRIPYHTTADKVRTIQAAVGVQLAFGLRPARPVQLGAENGADERMLVGLEGVRVSDLTLAGHSLDTRGAVEERVNTRIARAGAYQERLELAGANARTETLNLAAAESSYRDADMATLTRHQLLARAGTAMLAQASLSGELVLSLIRG